MGCDGSKSRKGQWLFAMHSTKMGIPIKRIEMGKACRSVGEAAKDIGLRSRASIYVALSDKRKTAGGFHWEYVDESGKEGKFE